VLIVIAGRESFVELPYQNNAKGALCLNRGMDIQQEAGQATAGRTT
jgi:hypothetical protein